jgi:hypothetical protein
MEQQSGFRICRAQTRLQFLYGDSYLALAAYRHAGGWQGEYYLLMQNPLRQLETAVMGFDARDLPGEAQVQARSVLESLNHAAHRKFSELTNDADVQFVEAGTGELSQLWMRSLYPQEWSRIRQATRCGKLASFVTAMERLPIVA